jgi:hypothetical protein
MVTTLVRGDSPSSLRSRIELRFRARSPISFWRQRRERLIALPWRNILARSSRPDADLDQRTNPEWSDPNDNPNTHANGYPNLDSHKRSGNRNPYDAAARNANGFADCYFDVDGNDHIDIHADARSNREPNAYAERSAADSNS